MHVKKNMEKHANKATVKIYVNKTDIRITFKTKRWYSFELLMAETMKLLGSTENKVTEDKNGEHLPHLVITKVVLVHHVIVNHDY